MKFDLKRVSTNLKIRHSRSKNITHRSGRTGWCCCTSSSRSAWCCRRSGSSANYPSSPTHRRRARRPGNPRRGWPACYHWASASSGSSSRPTLSPRCTRSRSDRDPAASTRASRWTFGRRSSRSDCCADRAWSGFSSRGNCPRWWLWSDCRPGVTPPGWWDAWTPCHGACWCCCCSKRGSSATVDWRTCPWKLNERG